MILSLTTKAVEGLKPEREPLLVIDSATKHLRLMVHPTGRKVWRWTGRIGDKVRTFTFGEFPRHSLRDARTWAAGITELKLGGMPLPPMTRAEKERAKENASLAEAGDHRTFDWLFNLYMEEEGNELSSAKERWRIYLKDIQPAIGAMSIFKIKHDDLAKVLRAKKAAGAPIVSNTIQSILRRVFRWGATTGRDLTGLENDPAQFLVKLTTPTERQRFLTDYEIGILFKALPAVDQAYGEALTVCLYLGMRRSEVFELTWPEVNFEAGDIEIDGKRTKNGRPLVLFMPNTVRDILARRKAATGRYAYVWPAIGSQEADGQVESGEVPSGRPFITFSKNTKRLNSECMRLAKVEGRPMEKFTIHDLRRTLSTGMHALKDGAKRTLIPSDVIERVLNHTIGGVRGVYNRHDYYEEKMHALKAWAAHLDAIKISTRMQKAS